MAGLRPKNFRPGDRAEYFAYYMLSSLAQVIPVPRQEDYGIDAICALTKTDGKALFVEDVFELQVKKKSDSVALCYGGNDKKSGKWKKHEIFWLVRRPVNPLIIALADVDLHIVDFYSTSNIWYARWMGGTPYEIRLLPDAEISELKLWLSESELKIEQKECDGHDGKVWSVPLGKPIARISMEDLDNEQSLLEIYKTLQAWLMLDLRNVTHQRLGIPYWERCESWTTNKYPTPEQFHSVLLGNPKSGQNIHEILTTLAPMIMTLYFNMHIQGDNGIMEVDRMVKLLQERKILTDDKLFQWASKQ